MPCSAATVIGIVCEAFVASRPELFSCARYSALNDPAPQPSSGFSRARSMPPRIRSKRPEVALSIEPESPRSSRSAPGNANTSTAPATTTASAGSATTLAPQRSHASTARPSSSAAKLDCESVVISPPQSTTSATIVQNSDRGRFAQISTDASPIITSARKRPKMFGSKKSELTRKYSSTWLEAITFGFSSRWRVWNSQKPIPVNTSARNSSAPPPHASVRGVHGRPRSSAKSNANGT